MKKMKTTPNHQTKVQVLNFAPNSFCMCCCCCMC